MATGVQTDGQRTMQQELQLWAPTDVKVSQHRGLSLNPRAEVVLTPVCLHSVNVCNPNAFIFRNVSNSVPFNSFNVTYFRLQSI
jgi:hypothetical protein